jgi:hypothetical protein
MPVQAKSKRLPPPTFFSHVRTLAESTVKFALNVLFV